MKQGRMSWKNIESIEHAKMFMNTTKTQTLMFFFVHSSRSVRTKETKTTLSSKKSKTGNMKSCLKIAVLQTELASP